MQIIPAGYIPTLAAARKYVDAWPDLVAVAAKANWILPAPAWSHFLNYGNTEGRAWDFSLTDTVNTPVIITTNAPLSTAAVLPSTIFGIDSKLVLIGAAVLLFFSLKD